MSLVELRHALHRHPDLSGDERATAERLAARFATLPGSRVVRDLGGHGLAVEFPGAATGPTVLVRCELDALPIEETCAVAYRSARPGVSHKCGHDGHMAIVAGVAERLGERPPPRGRVVLLFQPAEETGAGARAVRDDPRFAALRPDWAFALHNLPGVPLGQVVVRAGVFTCASTGLCVRLTGRAAHAAEAERGRSPARALARIIAAAEDLNAPFAAHEPGTKITIVGARLGSESYGVAPGDAELWITVRAERDASVEEAVSAIERQVAAAAADDGGLKYDLHRRDPFVASVNAPAANRIVSDAAAACGRPVERLARPLAWSEDFGVFLEQCPGALFGLGAGLETPPLHDPDYDFPDDLVPLGVELLTAIVDRALGEA